MRRHLTEADRQSLSTTFADAADQFEFIQHLTVIIAYSSDWITTQGEALSPTGS